MVKIAREHAIFERDDNGLKNNLAFNQRSPVRLISIVRQTRIKRFRIPRKARDGTEYRPTEVEALLMH